MSTSSSRLAYGDCFEIFDRAISDDKGVRLKFKDKGQARHFRTRMHTARAIDRVDNAKAFDKDHKMHGRSIYDTITVRDPRQEKDYVWVYIEKISIDEAFIENLSEIEEAPIIPKLEPVAEEKIDVAAMFASGDAQPLRRRV